MHLTAGLASDLFAVAVAVIAVEAVELSLVDELVAKSVLWNLIAADVVKLQEVAAAAAGGVRIG